MTNQTGNLWTVIQKLRGVANIQDVCHIALYALLLKQIDMIWEEVVIASPGLDNNERGMIFEMQMGFSHEEKDSLLRVYGEADYEGKVRNILYGLEKKFNIPHGILVDPFSDIKRKMQYGPIRMIHAAVDELSFESKVDLYETAEYLVLRMAGKADRSTGGTSTNVTLAELVSRLLRCDSTMTLYDGFCGTGIFVNKVAAKDTKLFIRDINIDMVSIATILCILGQKQLGRVECGDTLLNPGYIGKFDRIVAEPPFSVKHSKDYIERIYYSGRIPDKNIDGDSLAVFHCIDQLKDEGKAIIILPMGFLFRAGKTRNARKILLEMNVIDTIIELPEGCLPGTYAPAVMLILNRNRDADNILMINAKGLFRREKRGMALINDEGIDKIDDIYQRRAIVDGLSSAPTIRDIETADYGLSVAKYVVPTAEVPERESIKQLIMDYSDRQEQIHDLEKELFALRKRFVK